MRPVIQTDNIISSRKRERGLIFGVISRNMVRNRSTSSPIQNIPSISNVKDLVRHDWTLMLSFDGDTKSPTKVHVLQNTEFTPKQIKSLLINEVAMTLADLQTIQAFEISRHMIHEQQIHLASGHLVFSIFPSRTPTALLIERASYPEIATLNSGCVIWSTCSCEDAEDDALEFVCSREVSYQDFLIHYSKYLGYNDQGCLIEFEFHIYSKPVLFGKAMCVAPALNKRKPFFFARSLHCAELKKLFARNNRD